MMTPLKGRLGKSAICVGALFLVMIFASASSAEVPSGFGLGYQASIMEGMGVADLIHALSGRYWVNDNFGLEADAYFGSWTDSGEKWEDSADLYAFGLKGLYAPIVKDNSRFYLGLEAGYCMEKLEETNTFWGETYTESMDFNTFAVAPLFGAEYCFQGLPELGFNFEVGYRFNMTDGEYTETGMIEAVDTDYDMYGFFVGMGVHYFFGG